MKIGDRETKRIKRGCHIHLLVKLDRHQLYKRQLKEIPIPCYLGYEGWGLHSIINF